MATTNETNDVTADTPKKDKGVGMSDTRRIITLVIGDIIVFLTFAAIGRGNHGETTGLAALPEIALTAAPFALGWFLVSPFVGAFRRDIAADPRKMALRTSVSWVFSWPVGLLLRWAFSGFNHLPPFSFALVTLVANLILLQIWRWPFAFTNSMRKNA